MNLSKLFEMQKVLDERIIREKHLEGQDLLPNTILALQVELGELANEWRGFKHWSNDLEPRREKMLVEYVDCLHFILSIGLQCGFDSAHLEYVHDANIPIYKMNSIVAQFNGIFEEIINFTSEDYDVELYQNIVLGLGALGEMLEFTWGEIEQAYLDKNAVNHRRQEEGY